MTDARVYKVVITKTLFVLARDDAEARRLCADVIEDDDCVPYVEPSISSTIVTSEDGVPEDTRNLRPRSHVDVDRHRYAPLSIGEYLEGVAS